MLNGMLGKKIGMTQIFVENGNCIPVTVIEAGPCAVTEIKSGDRDGYQAVQLGFLDVKKKSIRKAQTKNFEKKGVSPKRLLREFRVDEMGDAKIGDVVQVDLFQEGEFVNVTGTTKGRGFAGVIKRHGFQGAPASRGSHEIFRGGGSIGMKEHPGRVFKGKKMAGHYGHTRCTTLNVEIVKVEKENNIIMIRGAAPGPNGGFIMLKKSNRKKRKS